MDEEPFIIAAWMEEERRRLEQKSAEDKQSPHHGAYQRSQNGQPAGSSIIAWIILGIIIFVIFLVVRN